MERLHSIWKIKKMDGGVRYAFCTKNGEKTWVYEEEEFTGNPEKHPYWAFGETTEGEKI